MLRFSFIAFFAAAVLASCSDSNERQAWKSADANARAYLVQIERDGYVTEKAASRTGDEQRAISIAHGFLWRDNCVARYKPIKTTGGYSVDVRIIGRGKDGYLYRYPAGGGFFSVEISSNWWNATLHPGM